MSQIKISWMRIRSKAGREGGTSNQLLFIKMGNRNMTNPPSSAWSIYYVRNEINTRFIDASVWSAAPQGADLSPLLFTINRLTSSGSRGSVVYRSSGSEMDKKPNAESRFHDNRSFLHFAITGCNDALQKLGQYEYSTGFPFGIYKVVFISLYFKTRVINYT